MKFEPGEEVRVNRSGYQKWGWGVVQATDGRRVDYALGPAVYVKFENRVGGPIYMHVLVKRSALELLARAAE